MAFFDVRHLVQLTRSHYVGFMGFFFRFVFDERIIHTLFAL